MNLSYNAWPSPAKEPNPLLRASDADRERYARHVTECFIEGRLKQPEHEELLSRIEGTVYVKDLRPLIAELPPLPRSEPDKIPAVQEKLAAPVVKADRKIRPELLLLSGVSCYLASTTSPPDFRFTLQGLAVAFILVALFLAVTALFRKERKK